MERLYLLQPYKGMNTRYRCPSCKEKEFVRYIDVETGKQVGSEYGRCNREINCGYHKIPPIQNKCYFVAFMQLIDYSSKSYRITTTNGKFYLPKALVYEISDNGCYISEWYLKEGESSKKPDYSINDYKYFSEGKEAIINPSSIEPKGEKKPVSFIHVEAFKSSLRGYENNKFVQFLISVFNVDAVSELVGKYFLGTSNHKFKSIDFPGYLSEKGSTIFWQIDITGKIRTGKIMLYDSVRGKRVKQPFNHISWVHKSLKLASFELKQCFFGEHLLKDKSKPIAIVESEKTAIIASVYLPQFIWLACGSINNLSQDKCRVLVGRRVVLFPDLNAFDQWSLKAMELSHMASFIVSDLLELKANDIEREEGLDLADYLIRFNYKDFIRDDIIIPTSHTLVPIKVIASLNDQFSDFVKRGRSNENALDQEIIELEHFFETTLLPQVPIQLNQCTKIHDVKKYIVSNLAYVKAHTGNQTFLAYLDQLKELRDYLIKHQN